MVTKHNNPEGSNKRAADYFDLTEESSKRPGGSQQARQAESDDVNEETAQGPITSPSGDKWSENKVTTSLDDDES